MRAWRSYNNRITTPPTTAGILRVCGILALLCSVFALTVTLYDHPREVVPVEGQIPYAGSRVRDDIMNAGVFGVAGAVLLFLSRLLQKRTPAA